MSVNWYQTKDSLRTVVSKRDSKARTRSLLRYYKELVQHTGQAFFGEDDHPEVQVAIAFETFWKFCTAMVVCKFRPFRYMALKAASTVFRELATLADSMIELDVDPVSGMTTAEEIADRVFVHLFNCSHHDVDEAVRLATLEELEGWIMNHPSTIKHKKTKVYFRRFLLDPSSVVREAAASLVVRLDEAKDSHMLSCDLVVEFADLLKVMAFRDVPGPQAAALQACSKLVEYVSHAVIPACLFRICTNEPGPSDMETSQSRTVRRLPL